MMNQETKEVAERLSSVDFVTTPIISNEETAAYLEEAIEEWGCSRFKFFLGYRTTGVDLTDGLFMEVLQRMAKYDGTVACVHAEDQEIIDWSMAKFPHSEDDGLAAWADANPGVAEAESIRRASFYAEQAGLPVYIVHTAGRGLFTQHGLACCQRLFCERPMQLNGKRQPNRVDGLGE